jgi:hypothetical protein
VNNYPFYQVVVKDYFQEKIQGGESGLDATGIIYRSIF